jgi:hypothetical protein
MPAEAGAIDAIDVALMVARAIDDVGGAYFVGGSLASSMQGEPRATNDIDIVVSIPLGRLRDFIERLGPDFEADFAVFREAMLQGSSCNIFYLPVLTKVDLFALGGAPFDEAEFSRRRPVEVRSTGEQLVIKTPEDTVLRKLLWFRAGGEVSERQWRDVVQVLRVSGPGIDVAYVDGWARLLRITSLVDKARREAEA